MQHKGYNPVARPAYLLGQAEVWPQHQREKRNDKEQQPRDVESNGDCRQIKTVHDIATPIRYKQ